MTSRKGALRELSVSKEFLRHFYLPMSDKKFYITTSIPYMNAGLHVGHAFEFVLTDILARYHRGLGERVFFLTGTDEHGDKIIASAQKEGVGTQEFVNKNVAAAQELLKLLNISHDGFIRTSDKEAHWPGAQKLWTKLEEAGDIYKGTYEGLYCVGCEAFITEKELVDGKCPHHGKEPESIKEENYFFKLSKYKDEIRRLLETGELRVAPASKANEMLALLSNDTTDISISRPMRTIPWGVPVPNDPGQLMYVWVDALSNYISGLGYGQPDERLFQELWPADVQVIGKDIARFHLILWIAFLLSAKLPVPKSMLVHGFINSDGKKMSKSIGNVLYAEEFINEYGADALRYYFAREVSSVEDGDLTRERFKEAYNANLANGLGNLVSRTLKMVDQYFAGRVSGSEKESPVLKNQGKNIGSLAGLEGATMPYLITSHILPRYHEYMTALEVNKAADVIWELVGHMDQYVTDYEPFKLVKTDKEAAERVLWTLVYGLHALVYMIDPIIPESGAKLKELLGTSSEEEGKTALTTKAPAEPLFMRKQ